MCIQTSHEETQKTNPGESKFAPIAFNVVIQMTVFTRSGCRQ